MTEQRESAPLDEVCPYCEAWRRSETGRMEQEPIAWRYKTHKLDGYRYSAVPPVGEGLINIEPLYPFPWKETPAVIKTGIGTPFAQPVAPTPNTHSKELREVADDHRYNIPPSVRGLMKRAADALDQRHG